MRDVIDWTPDRRRTLRVDVPARAAVDTHRSDSDGVVTLRQISQRGLVVEGRDALGPGTAYAVTLAVAGHPPLTLSGSVVHARTSMTLDADARVHYVTAVALDPMSDADAVRLRAIIDSVGGAAEEFLSGEREP